MAGQMTDRWESGAPYERYVGRWSRKVAAQFLSWLALPPGLRYADIGCGTGALCEAILDTCAPSNVTGIEPSQGFLDTARRRLGDRADLLEGNAAAIPLPDASVDVVVSGLVLNFVPDPRAALIEMSRIARDAGTLAGYVWDYAGRMELMRHFWDAAIEEDRTAAKLDEGERFPLCRPDALTDLFEAAGLDDVAWTPIDVPTTFASFDDYWEPFLGGQGPAPSYVTSLQDEARARLRDNLRNRLPTRPDGSITLIARAWAVRAAVVRR